MKKLISFLLINLACVAPLAFSDGYMDSDHKASASPKSGWPGVTESTNTFSYDSSDTNKDKEETPLWARVVLWVPNRVLDFVDIFRADVGIGAAGGAIVRVTPNMELGYRYIDPMSVRMGFFGRHVPALLEKDSEYGLSPDFHQSAQRQVCDGEFGIGIDAFVGFYAGICFDELADFISGIFFVDLKNDDLR